MLKRIEIHHIALIDHVELEFQRGLNVLSGETGAGKSILIDALNLVLGVRADRDLIQTGQQKAVVEAEFYDEGERVARVLEAIGLEKESTLVLSRELFANGRNVCRINGTLVNNASLAQVSECLIDIHGQHEHQWLFDASRHIDLLDAFGGEEIAKTTQQLHEDLKQLRQCERQLALFGGSEQEREQKLDILRYQYEEIYQANLQEDEDETLARKRMLMQHSQKVFEVFGAVEAELMGGEGGGLVNGVRSLAGQMRSISDLDPAYESLTGEFDEAYYVLEGAYNTFRRLQYVMEFDPKQAEQIEERLELINKLKKKYGPQLMDVIVRMQTIEEEIMAINHMAEENENARAQITAAIRTAYNTAQQLHRLRIRIAAKLKQSVTAELQQLGMSRVKFEVEFAPIIDDVPNDAAAFTHKGLDRVEFLLSPNAGQPLRPLSRIASGGEASRIMLALKNISAQVDGIDCLIFDEIDAGISGKIAHVVAQKLMTIAKGRQVLCVTHLAQLACMADAHFLIEKQMDDQSTKTVVARLDQKGQAAEVARLLGGEGEQGHGLAHAQELIAQAKAFKKAH